MKTSCYFNCAISLVLPFVKFNNNSALNVLLNFDWSIHFFIKRSPVSRLTVRKSLDKKQRVHVEKSFVADLILSRDYPLLVV